MTAAAATLHGRRHLGILHDGDHAWHVGILIHHGNHPIVATNHPIRHLHESISSNGNHGQTNSATILLAQHASQVNTISQQNKIGYKTSMPACCGWCTVHLVHDVIYAILHRPCMMIKRPGISHNQAKQLHGRRRGRKHNPSGTCKWPMKLVTYSTVMIC